MRKFLTLAIFFLSMGFVFAQDDLLNELDQSADSVEVVTATFKALQICNMQSTKMPEKGEFYFLVTHRFGDLTKGLDNFFGFDNALTKLGGIWGVTDWLSVSASRHTYHKIYETSVKYKIADQKTNGFPLSIVGYHTMDINSELKKDALLPGLKFNHRLAYTSQLLISRKFSEKFSMEVAPIYVHKNLYDAITDQKDLFLVGGGARYKLTKRLSVNAEFAAKVNLPEGYVSVYQNPLSIGMDLDTGGHVFQFVFSNSQPMNDVSLYSNTSGNWDGGGIYFGFNMYRVF